MRELSNQQYTRNVYTELWHQVYEYRSWGRSSKGLVAWVHNTKETNKCLKYTVNFKINKIKRKADNTQIHTDVIILAVDDGRWPYTAIRILRSWIKMYNFQAVFKIFTNTLSILHLMLLLVLQNLHYYSYCKYTIPTYYKWWLCYDEDEKNELTRNTKPNATL